MQKNRILLSLGLLAALSVGLIWFGLSQEVSPDSNAAPVSQAVPPTPVSQEETPDPADWRLCLVNPWHPLPEGYQPQLTQVENGHQVDSRCAADLEAMLADCRAAGHAPLLCSSYRTQEKQTQLYNNLVQKQIARGNSRSEAMAKAAKEVAVPGTSEHQLGLSADLTGKEANEWLAEHCWEYGFILRYPEGKKDITGIINDTWHFRYVGQPHAAIMEARGLTLEEYIAWLREFPYESCRYQEKNAIVSFLPGASDGPTILKRDSDLPCTISGNNVDGFIITEWRRAHG